MNAAGRTAQRDDAEFLSAECTVGKQAGFEALHGKCRQTKDVPLPHGGGLLLMRRCPCACHTQTEGAER